MPNRKRRRTSTTATRLIGPQPGTRRELYRDLDGEYHDSEESNQPQFVRADEPPYPTRTRGKFAASQCAGDFSTVATLFEWDLSSEDWRPVGPECCWIPRDDYTNPAKKAVAFPFAQTSFRELVAVKHWKIPTGGQTVPRDVAFRHRLSIVVEATPRCGPSSRAASVDLTASADAQRDYRVADVMMPLAGLPTAIVGLVDAGLLSLTWARERKTLAFTVLADDVATWPTEASTWLSEVVRWMHNVEEVGGRYAVDEPSAEVLYRAARRTVEDEDANECASYMGLVESKHHLVSVELRDYQKRAVAWMLCRELGAALRFLPWKVWEPAFDVAGPSLFGTHAPRNYVFESSILIRPATGELVFGEEACDAMLERQAEPETQADKGGEAGSCVGRGGLLCDSMGLGKTVELIQLLVCNQAPPGYASPARACGTKEEAAWETQKACVICGISIGADPESGREMPEPEPSSACFECGALAHVSCSRTYKGKEDRDAFPGFVCVPCSGRMSCHAKPDAREDEIPRSRATIIVVPSALLSQWKSELTKHAGSTMNVVCFEGLRTTGYIPQKILRDADIVVTTYEALRNDVNSANAMINSRGSTRHPKRYRPTPTPILSLKWWRVVLDESQMLRQQGSIFIMASRLRTNLRWCVTGTPASPNVRSVISMMQFLRLGSDSDGSVWADVIWRRAQTGDKAAILYFEEAVRQVMWRTEQDDVAGVELHLPKQTSYEVNVVLGPVERYYYRSLHDSARVAAMNRLQNEGMSLSGDDVLAHEVVIGLRQACCHPQVGSAGRALGRNLHQVVRRMYSRASTSGVSADAMEAHARSARPLTMEEVLDALIAKAQLAGEEAQRVLAASSNGLAAVLMAKASREETGASRRELLDEAVSVYKRTLKVAKQHADMFRLDSVQRMHILHNLGDAMDALTKCDTRECAIEREGELADIVPGIADSAGLRAEVQTMKASYIREARMKRDLLMAEFHTTLDGEYTGGEMGPRNALSITEDDELTERDSASRKASFWWERAIGIVMESSGDVQSFLDTVVQALLGALPRDSSRIRTLAHRITSPVALHSVLATEVESLEGAFVRLSERIKDLPGAREPEAWEVRESGQCKECREDQVGPPCAHCRSESYFTAVERHLYFIREDVDADDEHLQSDAVDTQQGAEPRNQGDGATPGRRQISQLFRGKQLSGKRRRDGDLRLQGQLETIARMLVPFVRRSGGSGLSRRMDTWFRDLDRMKKRVVAARKAFDSQKDYLGALDEAEMTVMRISLLSEGDDASMLTEAEKRFRVDASMLAPLQAQFQEEIAAATIDLRDKTSSFRYLSSLEKPSAPVNGGATTDDAQGAAASCPVCLQSMEQRVAVLKCGHMVCADCTLYLVRRAPLERRKRTIQCPTCRAKIPVREIGFATRSPSKDTREAQAEADDRDKTQASASEERKDQEEGRGATLGAASPNESNSRPSDAKEGSQTLPFLDNGIEVRGSVSSKVAALVRVLKTIAVRDSDAKSIVFSQWPEVLSIVEAALRTNGVSFVNAASASGSAGFGNKISQFRSSSVVRVLLLPLKRAGAGLNLTEATHVLLVEPSLNTALEAQAISRVHRIGQTRPTFVHRFVSAGTIEAKIRTLAEAKSQVEADVRETVTVSDVMELFVPACDDAS